MLWILSTFCFLPFLEKTGDREQMRLIRTKGSRIATIEIMKTPKHSVPTESTVRAVVLDMDGTLLNEHEQISDKTRDALIQLEKEGVKLILASGRSYTRLMPYAKELKMDEYGGYMIEVDGVALYDFDQNKRIKYHEMSPEELAGIFNWLTTQNAESQAMFDDGLFDYISPELYERKKELRKEKGLPDDFPWTAGPFTLLHDLRKGYPHIHYVKSAEEITCPINKIQIMQDEDEIASLYQRMDREWGKEFSIYRTTPKQLEVLPLGYSKGSTVARLMKEHGWNKDEVLVFGDGENDLSMFEVVDHSFAMGNAQDFVKAKAAHVAGSNREDGIVSGLQSLKII